MHQEVIVAGMGGQGVLVVGQLLAHATMLEGRNVVWFPAYGPETRGGTANCTVIMSTEEIGSPVSSFPDTLIAMNQLMLDKFIDSVRYGGLIVVNTSLANIPTTRKDCKIIDVNATDAASELGNSKAANMVALGAYIKSAEPVSIDSIKASMKEVLPERNHSFIPLNNKALDKGYSLID